MSSNDDLISVIIPTFNAERFISHTLQSVLRQSDSNFEVIAVDDCSTDHTWKILQDFEKAHNNLRIFQLDENSGGPAAPRNFGLNKAKGNLIAYVDADDIWKPTKLAVQRAALDDPNISVVASNYDKIDELGKLLERNFLTKYSLGRVSLNKNLISNRVNINSVLMRKTSIRFREDECFSSIEDWLFWLEHLISGHKIKIMNESLIQYRVVTGSISARGTNKQDTKSLGMLHNLRETNAITQYQYVIAKYLRIISMSLRRFKLK